MTLLVRIITPDQLLTSEYAWVRRFIPNRLKRFLRRGEATTISRFDKKWLARLLPSLISKSLPSLNSTQVDIASSIILKQPTSDIDTPLFYCLFDFAKQRYAVITRKTVGPFHTFHFFKFAKHLTTRNLRHLSQILNLPEILISIDKQLKLQPHTLPRCYTPSQIHSLERKDEQRIKQLSLKSELLQHLLPRICQGLFEAHVSLNGSNSSYEPFLPKDTVNDLLHSLALHDKEMALTDILRRPSSTDTTLTTQLSFISNTSGAILFTIEVQHDSQGYCKVRNLDTCIPTQFHHVPQTTSHLLACLCGNATISTQTMLSSIQPTSSTSTTSTGCVASPSNSVTPVPNPNATPPSLNYALPTTFTHQRTPTHSQSTSFSPSISSSNSHAASSVSST